MIKLKTIKIMRIVIIAVLLVSAVGIWGCANDSGPLSGFSPDKVEKVGFPDDNDTLYYEFPKADAESFVNVITNAELSGLFDEEFISIKGGGPIKNTRAVMKNGEYYDFNYLSVNGTHLLIINGEMYYCDEETVEGFRNIFNAHRRYIYESP